MNDLPIRLLSENIADFCRRHHIRKLAFFDSVLREDFGRQLLPPRIVTLEGAAC